MNLHDLVHRKDRSLKVLWGEAAAQTEPRDGLKRRSVRFSARSAVRLDDAHDFQCLRTFPRIINWRLRALAGRSTVQMTVLDPANPSRRAVLFRAVLEPDKPALEPELDWPVWAGAHKALSLELAHEGAGALDVEVSRAFMARAALLGMLRGVGVEVGPGLNPQVLPGPGLEVSYVEACPSPEAWPHANKRTDPVPEGARKELWSRYRFGDARRLDDFPDGSLDFIFSNHVFEHLMNPLGVLENWARKLRPGGVAAGVVPDARYCFDLRQPPSTREGWLLERRDAIWDPPHERYERWRRWTEPDHDPETLRARGFSIHVHYYTPETFSELGRILESDGIFGKPFLSSYPNSKDFGFAFHKT